METLTIQSPYFSRLHAWLNERFPYINFVSGALLYLLAKAVVCLSQAQTFAIETKDILAVVIPALHLFLLRVFDEHKDFLSDQIHYPERVVQRGIFTLREIRQLGYIAFALQTLCFFALKPSVTAVVLWGCLWTWTLLMTKEFFAKDWLKKHFLLYSISHQLITPILLLFLFSLATDELKFESGFIGTLVLSICTGALYEISRKTKGKEEETGDLSFSQLWGAQGALLILAGLTVLTAVAVEFLFQSLGLVHFGYRAALILMVALTLLLHWRYFQDPTRKNRKVNEGMAALIAAYGFVVPLVVALIR